MFAVIMAGGSGTRFWPASRERLPKQFLKITSDRTMFEETIDRVRPLVAENGVYAVVNALHAELSAALVGDRPAHILVEPVGRNTAACIGLAALHVRRRSESTPMVILPSDHFIGDLDGFLQTLRAAGEAARAGGLVTLGVTPARPETGYGYIEVGKAQGHSLGRSFYTVERFVEKPDFDTARGYLASGRYLWNSGIFVFTAKTILAELESCMPSLHARLMELDQTIGTDAYGAELARIYPELESISIDYGVMEQTEAPVYVLRADFGWSDVGSWQALYDLRDDARDEQANLASDQTIAIQSPNNLVHSETGRLVALLGVEGLVVVDTPDALLIADRTRSQDVKQFPALLKRRGKTDLF